MILPTSVRIAACVRCQLRCPLCWTTAHPLRAGTGKLQFEDFRRLIDINRQIRKVEFGGKGEVFLNESLPEMLRYAHERKVTTSIGAGSNLNWVTEEAMQALVRYETERVRCAIDGVTQATYGYYRVGGNLRAVLNNVQRINALKMQYRSSKPRLIFQFVILRHNQHELLRAQLLAKMLGMDFFCRLNYSSDFFVLSNEQMESARSLTGYASRQDYLERTQKHYLRDVCYHLWRAPQISWDGSILGCACNNFGAFPGNAFKQRLEDCLSSEIMSYARDMHLGRKPPREDIPCSKCEVYRSTSRLGNWITEDEVLGRRMPASDSRQNDS